MARFGDRLDRLARLAEATYKGTDLGQPWCSAKDDEWRKVVVVVIAEAFEPIENMAQCCFELGHESGWWENDATQEEWLDFARELRAFLMSESDVSAWEYTRAHSMAWGLPKRG